MSNIILKNVHPSETVLVTGTGRHAGTSAHVVTALLEARCSVRVLARSESERTKALAALGAEIVIGDFTDRRSLIAALDGVSIATFTYPIAGGIVRAAANFASAAREAKTPLRVVVMSMAVAHPDSPSLLGQAQWLAEEVLAWAGLDLCVLRIAALFFENITALHATSIKLSAAFANCFGSAGVPWISGLDAAQLMVAAVLRPELFSGEAIHYPPGAELRSHAEIAEMLSAELGKPVRFDGITQQQWAEALVELSKEDAAGVINANMAQHIPAVGAALAAAKVPIRAPNKTELQRITGRPPLSMREFVAQNRAVFS
jgi:uncharacterized protein YbjT (DUF2867 family)